MLDRPTSGGPRRRRGQGNENGVYWHNALAPALGFADTDHAAIEVDVIAVQAEQLRAAQPAVSEQGQQQPAALPLAGVNPLPQPLLAAHVQEPRELVAVKYVWQRLSLLRRA